MTFFLLKELIYYTSLIKKLNIFICVKQYEKMTSNKKVNLRDELIANHLKYVEKILEPVDKKSSDFLFYMEKQIIHKIYYESCSYMDIDNSIKIVYAYGSKFKLTEENWYKIFKKDLENKKNKILNEFAPSSSSRFRNI